VTRTLPFSKWHGLGNDYLLIERIDDGSALTPRLVTRLCDYHFGIGADGVLEVVSADSRTAEVVIWNPDGSTAELSGNGTRIAARWLARRAGADEVRIRVSSREVVARMRGALEVEMEMGTAHVRPPETLDVDGSTLEFTPVSVGNPHAVIAREPERDELLRLGPLIETHPRFPDRTNVQFVRVDSRAEATVGVWERGAGETLSSGTSACAVAAAAVANGWCDSLVTVHLAGGDLLVEIEHVPASNRVDGEMLFHARLTGPAQEICHGEVARELLDEIRAR
jgi:diaminopimelate epimerase